MISVLVIKFEVEVKDSEHITIPLNFIKEFVVHTKNELLKTTFPYTWFNLPFERAYRYLERERIAKAVLFLYTKIVAVFPYTVVQTPGPRIREEKKVRMRWR